MYNVFLVDDEYYERMSLKNSLPWEDLGMKISGEANNGLTAYEMMIENPPDIAIVDINMPKLNGLDLISRLCGENLQCQYIILTGYDEFKYAQRAIKLGVSDYILKPINYQNLMTTLNGIRQKIEQRSSVASHYHTLETENRRLHLERYYNDLVNCSFSIQSIDQYDKNLAQQLFLNYDSYQVAVFEFEEQPSLNGLYALQDKISESFGCFSLVSCPDNKRRLFFIFDGTQLGTLPNLIYDLLDFTASCGHTANAGIGSVCSELEKLFLSYNEACIALQNCAVRRQNVVSYSEIHMPTQQVLDSKKKNLLRAMISSKETEKLGKFLTDIYAEFGKMRVPWDVIVLHTLEFINLLTECLSSQMSASISILGEEISILDTLNSKRNIDELCDWLIGIYNQSLSKISEKETYSDITQCVETYIQKNYGDSELSITAISKSLFLNYSYLCYCFKRDKQMTINDYINQVRIQKAIELFKKKNDNVGYVAEQTGFTSASYFSKQFKKATGVPPTDYLKSLEE